jgi:hypothetical protein
MGSKNSTPVKNGQKFTLKTKAKIMSDDTITPTMRDNVFTYLNSSGFKKRATTDLNNNHAEDGKIKIMIDNISVNKNLSLIITGNIKVLKKESEETYLVEDSLVTSLPHSSSVGEHMPKKSGNYRIQFIRDETSVTL